MPASSQSPATPFPDGCACIAAAETLAAASGAPLAVGENGFCARLIEAADHVSVEAFERLRYGYFVQQRGWVAEDAYCPGRESDGYDASSHHLAAFKDERLVAYLRVLPWRLEPGFMLEREFRCLLPPEIEPQLRRQNAVELTRLVIAPRSDLELREVPEASELLFKLFYRLALRCGWEHLYIVVEQGWLPLFSRRFGLRFEPLGCPQTFPDGTRTVAAQARVTDLEAGLAQSRPNKLDWYREP
jgi:N-acyl-L-homoserine lactone synthetase